MLWISFFSETGAEKLWVSFGMGKKLRYYISLVMSNMNLYPCDAALAACNMTCQTLHGHMDRENTLIEPQDHQHKNFREQSYQMLPSPHQ